MSEDRMESQRREWKHLDNVAAEIAAERASMTTDIGAAIDAKPLPEIVIKPGFQHARRAFELGMEDEYSNRMKARYGGEW